MDFFKSAKIYAELIKLGHTLFALPFALSALCLAYLNGHEFGWHKIFWTIVAFAGARSAAMGFNRIVDVRYDALNPRTMERPTVTGKISLYDAKIFTAISTAVFLVSAAMINRLCFFLAFPALAVLFGYSYAKRFTFAAHYILGAALALAPVGAWIAAADSFDPRILSLGFALFFNIAAFDLIYALQDMEFDKKNSLHSIPAKFGRPLTLAVASVSFALAAFCLAATGVIFKLGAVYGMCVFAIALLYAAGVFSIIKFGERKTELVFFYENISVSGLILFGIASNMF